METHVAVLVLDTPILGVAETFGDFGDNVCTLLQDLPFPLVKYQIAFDDYTSEANIAQTDATLVQLARDIDSKVVRGVVLTGSRSDLFATDIPWLVLLDRFIQDVLLCRAGFPMVGICFGHQVLAKNLGCKVGRNTAENGWEAGIHTVALNKSIVDIELSPFRKALLTADGKLLEHINLVQFHMDVVYSNPPATSTQPLLAATTFQNVGNTPKCSIQGLITELGPIKVLTFQGHPEFISDEALAMLKRLYDNGSMDKASYERLAYKTSNLENQGQLIGQVIRDFICTYYDTLA
ncbi:hypothetical protein PUMCH_004015 [Australozyma saopauloensis]|uniref:Glutamine amidotransferase domain-containing protein n=1 Tax=Australozyma saopauloensis TaxID=291208 RepID=A0AAX4HE28_9ASCO|nr:hypothetical protein PUMCH_004015 [[Candida] saopauloensis]